LPLRDGSVCFQNPGVLAATAQVRSAAATTLCFPVYNHQANAAPKNFAEVTNEGWKDNVVGLVASGGTNRSALVPRSLAHALMVDHRCMIVPRFVVVTPAHFAADGTLAADGETASRLADLSRDVAHLSSHWPRENRTV
jgi:NAD(P)H-dependent FMN reductase